MQTTTLSLSLLGAILLSTVVAPCQQPGSKPAPASLPHQVDHKRGPATPWVAPPAERRPRRSGASDKPGAVPAAATAIDPFAGAGLPAVLWDRPAAGELWAAAARFKAGFAGGRAVYVPFLGSDAPRSYPLALRLERVTVGGAPLAIEAAPAPVRTGDRVVFDHGAVRVRYDVGAAGLEQSFAFRELPGRGEMVISVAVDTELEASETDRDLLFGGRHGGVTYGRATVLDAAGRSLAIERCLRDGRIEIRVPEGFVRSAVLPLVVDPLVGTATSVASNTRTLRDPDIAFDVTSGRYLVTCELVFSATDSDVYSYEIDGSDGRLIAGSFTAIDSSTASWQAPRVANNNLANRYLVVAQVSANSSSPYSIRGRTRDARSTTMGAQFTISAPDTPNRGDKLRPDVAGDPHRVSPTHFTVVWERVFSTTDHDIHARQVTNGLDPSLLGTGETLIDNSGGYEEQPQVSSSMGAPDPNALFQKAMVVYRRRTASGTEIRGRLIRWDGVLDPGFVVAAGDALQSEPSVSTVTRPNGNRDSLYLVAWEQGYITDGGDTNDIKVALCSQQSQRVSPVYLLHQLEGGSHGAWDQYDPRVASDGCRFVVTYGEDYRDTGDLDVRASTLHAFAVGASGYELGVSEGRVEVAFLTTVESDGAVCSRFESADPDTAGSARYAFAWADARGTAANEVRSQLYDGHGAGGFITLLTGCGSTSITYSGRPVLGERMQVAASAQVLLFGVPNPFWNTPICSPTPCRQGVINFVQVPAAVTVDIPCRSVLLGASVAFQGVSPVGGPCFGGLSLTDTVVATIQ